MIKKIILFIGYFVPADQISKEIRDCFGNDIEIAILYDKNRKNKKIDECSKFVDYCYAVDTDSLEPERLLQKIGPNLLSATVRGESSLDLYKRLLPELSKYVLVPSPGTISIVTSKLAMRKKLNETHPELSVGYIQIGEKESIEDIAKSVGARLKFPVIIKPTGLSTSMLVSKAENIVELASIMQETKQSLDDIYKLRYGRGEKAIVVEEFIEGQLYSVDAYVDENGNAIFCPLVKTITGINAGKKDYYGYFQVTPSGLDDDEVEQAEIAAQKLIKAVDLKNSSAHVELIRAPDGWKIVEIGPRLGGYRSQLYKLAYNTKHSINDILIHFKPNDIVIGEQLSYSAMCKIYPNKEGTIKIIDNVLLAQEIEGVRYIMQNLFEGQEFLFARNGGVSVFEVIIQGNSESELRNILNKVEKTLKIHIE